MAEHSPVTVRPEAHTYRAPRLIGWLLRTTPLRPVRLGRADWLYIAGIFVLTRLLVLFLGLLGAALFPAAGAQQTFALQQIGQGNDWARLFAHFDSGWYLGISHGYLLPSSGRADWLAEWAFFPLYPMALHPVSVALGALHAPPNTDVLAGVIVSYAAFFGSLIYLYRLVVAEVSQAAARRSIFYLAIFPAAVFFSAVYPESLFLFMTVGAFYHARRRQWALAGIFATGALLTRPQGLFLLAPLALEFVAAWRASAERGNGRLLKGLWLGLPLLALGGYALYSHAETGYWFAFSVSATKAWGHRLTPPPYPLVRFLMAPTLGSAFTYDFSSINFAVALIFLVLCVVAFRRLPPSYGLWLLIAVLFPLATNGHFLYSYVRYVSTAFPAFVALAAWSLGQRWSPTGAGATGDAAVSTSSTADWRDRLVVVPSLLLLAVYVVLFVNGYPAGI